MEFSGFYTAVNLSLVVFLTSAGWGRLYDSTITGSVFVSFRDSWDNAGSFTLTS